MSQVPTTGEGPAAVLRPHAEVTFAAELAALEASDAVSGRPRPPRWHLSPQAVVTYLVGGTHKITAVFTSTNGNFSNSSSPALTQVVQSTLKTTTILTSQPDPSLAGAPVTLTAKVFGTPPVPPGSSPLRAH